MDASQLFLLRYGPLYDFWLAGFWQTVPEELMRRRPHPRLNPIAWILWHVTRVEDSTLNRFVSDRRQVLDEGEWLPRLNLPWRHQGSGMTPAEVDDLGQRIDLRALHDYSNAVQARTLDIVNRAEWGSPGGLDDVVEADRVHVVLFDEGLAGPNATGLAELYTGWTKGKFLMNQGLTHAYQHVGEIEVIATLHGIEF
jgi:hypothetical protein